MQIQPLQLGMSQMEPLQMTPVAMRGKSHLGETQEAAKTKTFGEFLADELKEVNDLQLKSDQWMTALAAGKVDDISQVVVATQKAEIALQLTLQLRNRVTSAYQEIMRMQV